MDLTSDAIPGSAATGDLYVNTGTGNPTSDWAAEFSNLTTSDEVKDGDYVIKGEDNWVFVSSDEITVAPVIIADSAPNTDDLQEGALWWNSDENDGQLYVLYEDTDPAGGKIWVEASPSAGAEEVEQQPVGGGDDEVFFLNSQIVTQDYTIPSGKNALSAGPITVSDGITVTVPNGQGWAVV